MSLPTSIDLGEDAVLRRYTMGDLEQLWAVVQAERDHLAPWMPWIEATRTVEDQAAWLRTVVDRADSLGGCGVFVAGHLAGACDLTWDPFRISGDIGYWLRASFEGRGLITRSARAITDVAFAQVGLNRVVIRAGVENERSRAIAERLGFTSEGIARGEGRGSGGFYDLVVYAMLADEWRVEAG